MSDKICKSASELHQELSPEQYHVCCQKGTERPFSGKYHNHNADGVYSCVCCGAGLFNADSKFDSGSGWPSFWAVIHPGQIKAQADFSHGMQRIEVSCAHCGAHLGHVFDDGPAPTGKRYCINSLSLDFIPH